MSIAAAPTYVPGYRAVALRYSTYRRLLWRWGLGIAIAMAVLAGISALISKPSPKYVCPPECGRPPIGKPVETNPRFTAPDGSYSVSYPAPGSAYKITTQPTGVTADLLVGDRGTMRLFSQPAAGQSPGAIAAAVVKRIFPDTQTAYQIPNAMVGYQPGYGIAADAWPQGANSTDTRMRVLVMVAVKNDLALVVAAVGPYHQFGPDFGSGKPSAADLEIALDMGQFVNSFSWRGDPPR